MTTRALLLVILVLAIGLSETQALIQRPAKCSSNSAKHPSPTTLSIQHPLQVLNPGHSNLRQRNFHSRLLTRALQRRGLLGDLVDDTLPSLGGDSETLTSSLSSSSLFTSTSVTSASSSLPVSVTTSTDAQVPSTPAGQPQSTVRITAESPATSGPVEATGPSSTQSLPTSISSTMSSEQLRSSNPISPSETVATTESSPTVTPSPTPTPMPISSPPPPPPPSPTPSSITSTETVPTPTVLPPPPLISTDPPSTGTSSTRTTSSSSKTKPTNNGGNGGHGKDDRTTTSPGPSKPTGGVVMTGGEESSVATNRTAITIGVVTGSIVVAGGIGVWIFRKWKLSPSRQFKSKIRNSTGFFGAGAAGAAGFRSAATTGGAGGIGTTGGGSGAYREDYDTYKDLFRPQTHENAMPMTASSMTTAPLPGSVSPMSVNKMPPRPSPHQDHATLPMIHQAQENPRHSMISNDSEYSHYARYASAAQGTATGMPEMEMEMEPIYGPSNYYGPYPPSRQIHLYGHHAALAHSHSIGGLSTTSGGGGGHPIQVPPPSQPHGHPGYHPYMTGSDYSSVAVNDQFLRELRE